jgi:hypothetical protein
MSVHAKHAMVRQTVMSSQSASHRRTPLLLRDPFIDEHKRD